MWLVFGIGAAVFAVWNVSASMRGKDAAWFRFIILSLTALTLCAFYADGAARVIREDWGGLMDIMPSVSRSLWVCTGGSILLNAVSLFHKPR